MEHEQPQASDPGASSAPQAKLVKWPFRSTQPLAVVATVISTLVGLALLAAGVYTSQNTLMIDDPIRSLTVMSLGDRELAKHAAQQPAPLSWLLQPGLSDAAACQQAWDELEPRLAEELDWELPSARIARDVLLAGWGDETASARVLSASEEELLDLGEELVPELRRLRGEEQVPGWAQTRPPPDFSILTRTNTALVTTHLILLGCGLVVGAWWLLRGRPEIFLQQDRGVGAFGLGRGYAVLSWGCALAVVLLLAGAAGDQIVPGSFEQIMLIGTGILGLPLLILVRQLLLAPLGTGLWGAYGIDSRAGTFRLLLGATLAVVALDQALAFATQLAANFGLLEDSWIDFVLEEVLFGSWGQVFLTGLDAIVFAPLFEELAFRGVLYPALRTRMPPLAAALLSGVIFGAVHGYSLAGFVSVSAGGVVYALIYERTRSLLPCILAHGANNTLAMISLLAYRPLVA